MTGCKHQLRMFMVTFALLATVVSSPETAADETDQFTLPPRDSFVELGPYIDRMHYHVLKRTVDDINARIDKALQIPNDRRRTRTLESLHQPERLADRARHHFGQGFVSVRMLHNALQSRYVDEAYPQGVVLWTTPEWIYANSHWPIDPRIAVLTFTGPTVQVHGVHFGIDKFGHAFDLGHLYYKSYRRGLKRGLSEEQALRRTVFIFSRGPVSEVGVIGVFATGVISNADLASNYIGMKWYMNMTEPVMLQGELHPPLLVRVGAYWALNHHVRPDSPFMAPFYSDHLNEALNPCTYEWGMRTSICNHLRDNAEQILAFYAHEDGTRRTRDEFVDLARSLSTYYGEPYGYWAADPRATIADACFDDDGDAVGDQLQHASSSPQ